MDYAHDEIDKRLKVLEKRIQREYGKAVKEAQGKLDKYFETFKKNDAIKAEKVKKGELTEAEYQEWRKRRFMDGERWQGMRDTLAQDYLNAHKIAESMTLDFSYEAFALNRNFSMYEMEFEGVDLGSFTMYDKHTVQRLLEDDPDLYHTPGYKISQAIREKRITEWNKQHIQSEMLRGILTGESIPNIAKRLPQKVGLYNIHSAVRDARTITTGAENAGRVDGYKYAQSLGVKVKQMWMATLDGRTRHSHRQLDGEQITVGEKFSNGCRYPGDPEGRAEEIYNCRCTLVGVVKGSDVDLYGINGFDRWQRLDGQSYEEWRKSHEGSNR